VGASVARKPLAALHDMELVGLSAAGERAAFGELVRRHGTLVRALIRRMGADAATADDVAQDAFLAAYERIGDFRGEGAFGGWVRRIAARLYVRRARRRLKLEAEPSAPEEASAGGEGAAAARLDLDGALAELSPAERVCVSMCYGAGLTHAETAEALGAPLGTVKSHVKRGLEKLRRRLGAEPPRASALSPAGGIEHDC
jgi:RNA polymerase sigma factor (sigma-70 family)